MTPPSDYVLVFSDDFDGPALDTAKWRATTQAAFSGYGAEIWDAARVAVANGHLALTATPDRHAGEVRSIAAWGYGYYECRAKLPSGGPGFWPAFWTLSSIGSYQEIDVSECSSAEPRRIGMNLHWGVAGNSPSSNGGYVDPVVSFQADFHTYGCVYAADRIEFYVDDIQRRTWAQPAPPVITDPMQVRLSFSIFGPAQTYAAQPDASTVWPGVFLVDWVRVWQAGTTTPVVVTKRKKHKP